MRMYGTSPLYNYVELMFRCKRLFIISIILGTVITSVVVRLRQSSYSGLFVAALAGDPDAARNQEAETRRPMANRDTPAVRKSEKLMFWLSRDRDFLASVIRHVGMDRGLSPDEFDALLSKVRKAIDTPKMFSSIYVEVGMTWTNPVELEKILNQIYTDFASKTVETETVQATSKRQFLDDQFKNYDKQAKAKSRARMEYLTTHYWQQGSLASVAMGALDRSQTQLVESTMELSEAQSRLKAVMNELKNTPPKIKDTEQTEVQVNQLPALQAQKLELEGSLKKLLDRYAESHPSVIAMKKEIAAIDEQIKNPPKPTVGDQQIKTTNAYNPKWVELQKLKTGFTVSINGLNRRVASLEREITKQTARVRQMPGDEVKFQDVDRAFRLADTIRNQTETQLAAARIDEERDTFIQAKSVALAAPPKAEPLDSSGKTVVLYALGPILGIIIAFAFSLLVETLDHTLRTPVEVERYLGKPVLAVIPRMQAPRDGRKQLGGSANQSITS